jgi:Cd2+/Zn2+-exporting ATPase
MIGRFSHLGEYRELFRKREVLQCLSGGALALLSWAWAERGLEPAWAAMALGLAAVAVNGLPIVWGAAQGLLQRRVNVDDVALGITDAIQGEVLTAAVWPSHGLGSNWRRPSSVRSGAPSSPLRP